MNLTEHFTLDEMTHSDTATELKIDNTCPPYLIPRLTVVAQGMEQVRELLGGVPLKITSGYRCPNLNKAVGSKPTSQHISACACDFKHPTMTPHDVVAAIVASPIDYDQVIEEGLKHKNWVHISFSDRNRKQALVIDDSGTRGFA